MLTKAWKKIDRFYLILAIVLLLLAAPMIYTALGVFSAFITAYEIDTSAGKEVRIDKARLDQAVSSVYDRDIPPIEVRESSIVVTVGESESKNE